MQRRNVGLGQFAVLAVCDPRVARDVALQALTIGVELHQGVGCTQGTVAKSIADSQLPRGGRDRLVAGSPHDLGGQTPVYALSYGSGESAQIRYHNAGFFLHRVVTLPRPPSGIVASIPKPDPLLHVCRGGAAYCAGS